MRLSWLLRISLVLPLALSSLAFGQDPPRRPNIVVLLSDDLGYRDIGCYDGTVQTPALDSLAKGGTRFETFYSGCAVCSPSRATLLTGRHHIRTGVYSWIFDTTQKSHLLEREVTIAEVLKAWGYQTAHVGKWHLGLPSEKIDKPTPSEHGFDYWFATSNNAEPSHRNPVNFIRNGEPVGELEGYSCQLVVDEALTWLDQKRDLNRPFFLNVWFHEPHAQLAAPEEMVEIYGKPNDKAALYSATIHNENLAVARLLEKLKKISPIEETLIIYASDNGSYRKDRVGNLRGQKGINYEGGLRVPGIFCWPGTIKSGHLEVTPAGVVDILPTICGLLEISPPLSENGQRIHLDGSDLTPLLIEDANRGPFVRHQPLFWHLQKSRPIVAMRDGNFVLTADPDYELSTDNMFDEAWIPRIRQGGYTNYQLFDLGVDPSQTTNVADKNPELVAKMKADLLKINQSIMADGVDWNARSTDTDKSSD